MNTLLIFFALPIAVVIISIALQKILKNPLLVAAIIFAIFLIVTFIVNDLNFLVAAIAYTILSFITAFITYFVCQFLREQGIFNPSCCRERRENIGNSNSDNNVMTIANGQTQVGNHHNGCNQNNNTNGISYQITSENGVTARISVIPNGTNNGNGTGQNTNGCCRR